MKRLDSDFVPACLLCGSQKVRIIDQFPFRDLRLLFFETCEVDINFCLDQPYPSKSVFLYSCVDCGLEFYPPSLQGNARLYEALGKFEYYYSDDKWEFKTALQDAAGSSDVLEIGCGRGAFLTKVRKMNPRVRAVGLETNPGAIEFAKNAGLELQAVTIEQFASKHKHEFDFVCAFQVLEHVKDPAGFLSNAFACVKPGGLCGIGVPNAVGFTRYAVNNFGDMPPHHLTRWTDAVMRNVAAKFNVTLDKVLYEPVALRHREWYRNTRTAHTLAKLSGWQLKRVETGLGYRLLISLSSRIQKCIPSNLWAYSRFSGHTLYAAFRL